MKTSYDSQQRRLDNQLPFGWDDEDDRTNDLMARLDELDKKEDQYETSCESLLDQMSELLSKIGGSESRDERCILRIRLANIGEEIQVLRPMTVEEIAERDEIMERLKGDE